VCPAATAPAKPAFKPLGNRLDALELELDFLIHRVPLVKEEIREAAYAIVDRTFGGTPTRHARRPISAMEHKVLTAVRAGLADKEIAPDVGLHLRTVKFHVSNLLKKFNVSSRLGLVTNGKN
jgi:DNA-binding NarL/FixJ family response regulator